MLGCQFLNQFAEKLLVVEKVLGCQFLDQFAEKLLVLEKKMNTNS